MKLSIPEHSRGPLCLPSFGQEEQCTQAVERIKRIDSLNSEQMPLALAFLAGYHPLALDAALDAVTPPAADDDPAMEPYCLVCHAPVGVFLAHGPGYKHYRGVVTATSKPRPYKADHKPVIGWRPAADTALAKAI
jgi:hypothetical protein